MGTDSKGTLTGALLGLVAAALGLASAFGLSVSPVEHDAILTFSGSAAVVAPFVGALLDHSKRQVAAREEAATTIAAGTTPEPNPAQRQAASIQAQIDRLQAEKDSLGRT